MHPKIHQRFSRIWRKPAIIFLVLMWSKYMYYLCPYFRIIIFYFILIVFLFFFFRGGGIFPLWDSTYISSRVLLSVFKFNFSFCVNNGLEKECYSKFNFVWFSSLTNCFQNSVIYFESSHLELLCKIGVLKCIFAWDYEVFQMVQHQLRKIVALLKEETHRQN